MHMKVLKIIPIPLDGALWFSNDLFRELPERCWWKHLRVSEACHAEPSLCRSTHSWSSIIYWVPSGLRWWPCPGHITGPRPRPSPPPDGPRTELRQHSGVLSAGLGPLGMGSENKVSASFRNQGLWAEFGRIQRVKTLAGGVCAICKYNGMRAAMGSESQ